MKVEGIWHRIKWNIKKFKQIIWCGIAGTKESWKELFYANIPSEYIQNLPSQYAGAVGSALYLIVLGLFILVFILSFLDAQSERYLALSKDAGDCTKVSRSLDGEYLLDDTGTWEGAIGFTYSAAVYSFDFNNFLTTNSEFEESMRNYLLSLSSIGEAGRNESLSYNLLYWMAWAEGQESGGSYNTVKLTGNPSVIFDRKVIAAIGNEQEYCPLNATTSFDKSLSLLMMKYDNALFTSTPACMDILNPFHAGYDAIFDGDIFSLSLDVRSLVIALSVNLNVTPLAYLDIVAGTESTLVNGNITVVSNSYYFSIYAGMQPILCSTISSVDGNVSSMCGMLVGDILMLPTFNHAGASSTTPEYCFCDTPIGTSSACNSFNLMVGLLFYDFGSNRNESIAKLAELASQQSMYDINRNSYNASFDVANYLSSTRGNDVWREKAYEFCRLSDGTSCSILSAYVADSSLHSVSTYYYQVNYGSCNNTLSLSESAMVNAATNPPRILEQDYLECRSKFQSVLINTAGVAQGNMSVVVPFVVTVLVWLFGFYANAITLPETYSIAERNEALDFFAFNLLLARDGRYKRKDRTDSVILNLQTELGENESIDRFYVKTEQPQKGESIEVEMKSSSLRYSDTNQRVSSVDLMSNPLHKRTVV